jgi:sugar lactone lactonase YvrE
MAEATTGLAYRPARRMAGKGPADHQFRQSLHGLAVDDEDRLHAVGDSAVKVFSAQGDLVRQWPTGQPGYSVTVDGDGLIWIGQWRQVEIFDAQGTLVDTWKRPEELGLVSAVAVGPRDVFLADASGRCIRRFDREGRFLNNIGDRHRKGGFDIPNGVVDFALDGQGLIHVANPGMHRVERYTADGELVGRFGRFDGRDPEGFPGCCNPTNLTLDLAGRVIVSEKAGPRVKVYDPSGQLLSVVAAEGFDPGAKNMDLAVDSRGRIYAADTVTLEIHVFTPSPAEARP